MATVMLRSLNESGGRPFIITMRSPGLSPGSVTPSSLALLASVVAAGLPGRTCPIVAGSVLRPTLKTTTKRTAAARTFITTPAEITIIRFHGLQFW